MAWGDVPVLKLTGRTAAADLSTLQYRGVKLAANRQVAAIAADTDRVIGVQQGAAVAGDEVEVMLSGLSKMVASAAIAEGAPIGVAADGRAVTRVEGTDTTKYIIGLALEAAANAGDIIPVWLYGAPYLAK